MIKKIKYFILLLIFTLFANCSFDNKTGIWSGDEKEKKRIAELEKQQKEKIEVKKIYSQENIYSKEISATKNAILTKPRKNSSWKMSGLNLQNFLGNIYLSNIDNNFLKKKIGKNKFSISKTISSPITFEHNIIFADDVGTIYSIDQRGKVNWKKNIYKKIYKKIYKHLTFSIYKDKIYIADNVGFIYAMSLKNGKVIWIKKHGIPLKSNIKIFEDKIYLINQENRLLCLDIKEGTMIWDIRSVTSFIKTQNFLALAISKEGDLVSLSSSGDLFKANANNGSIYWSLNITDSMYAQDTDFFKSSNIVLDNKDIIFATASSIFSYNLDNGFRNWKQDIESQNTPIIDGNNVFLVSDNGYFVNLNRQSGKIISSTNILKILKKKKQITKITGFVLGLIWYVVLCFGVFLVCFALFWCVCCLLSAQN